MLRSLVLLAGSLAAVIAGEIVLHTKANRTVAALTQVPVTGSSSAIPASITPDDGHWLTTVLGRPLFAPLRRPAPGVTVVDATLPRLAGIIKTGGATTAIFQADGDGKRTVVHSGDRVAGWRVAAIEPEALYLEKSGERVMLTPRFAAGSAAGPVAAPQTRL